MDQNWHPVLIKQLPASTRQSKSLFCGHWSWTLFDNLRNNLRKVLFLSRYPPPVPYFWACRVKDLLQELIFRTKLIVNPITKAMSTFGPSKLVLMDGCYINLHFLKSPATLS